jgi:hypothetical protein
MNIKMNPTVLALVGGIVAILIVGGAGAYFELVMAVAPSETVTPITYSAQAIGSLSGTNGLINRVEPLQAVPLSAPSAIKALPGDIGKADLTKLE